MAATVAIAAVACAAAPTLAHAGAVAGVDPSRAEASDALAAAEQALGQPAPAEPGREATAALSALADALPALAGAERRRAQALLARPTDGAADPIGDGYAVAATSLASPSGRFCVWYVTSTADAPGGPSGGGDPAVPDYAESVAAVADLTYSVEVGDLGWVPPKPDTDNDSCGPPASSTADVYLKDVGGQGLYGYEVAEPSQTGRSRSGYLVIDDDYSPAQFPGYAEPLDAAQVTLAHEFNHLLQERYDAIQDLWMFESTAVWMEEQVFPAVNDFLDYVPRFAGSPGTPITDPKAGDGLRAYGTAVWEHWLQRRYGANTVRRAWEVSTMTKPPDFAVAAFDRAVADTGGRGFAREFGRFAAATAEWRSGDGGFPDATRYPDVRRKGKLKPGVRRPKRFELDHTAYRLFDVKPVRAKRIRLKVKAARRVRSGIALVGRRGDEVGGRVRRKVKFMRRGGKRAVSLGKPGRFRRITAVIVNADGRENGFSAATGDWRYTRDASRYRARVKKGRR